MGVGAGVYVGFGVGVAVGEGVAVGVGEGARSKPWLTVIVGTSLSVT